MRCSSDSRLGDDEGGVIQIVNSGRSSRFAGDDDDDDNNNDDMTN